MRTLKENVSFKLVVEKSVFITELIKIKDVSLVKDYLLQIREKYKDANHYCYAYIIDDNKKSSDDGEPGGTAGVPMMEVLNKYDLNYVLCIVIRYFGGIKLGAGGLVRTYRKSVADALKEASFLEVIDGYHLVVEVPYNKQSEIEYYLNCDYTKRYELNVIYDIYCSNDDRDFIKDKFNILSEEKKKIEVWFSFFMRW